MAKKNERGKEQRQGSNDHDYFDDDDKDDDSFALLPLVFLGIIEQYAFLNQKTVMLAAQLLRSRVVTASLSQTLLSLVNNLIERLRGNLVVGCPSLGDNETGFEEEEWSEVRIGDLLFKSGGPCTRCATICTDQNTGERSPEPLLTLSAMRNGRANFGIHLYNIPDNSPVQATTISASASLLPVDAQQSISPSWAEKVHIRTIKPWSGVDEPLQENGIATVPSGRYSAEKNKTPLEKLHGAFSETELQTSEAMMMEQAAAPKTVQNSGTKLKNRQLSSNSSSESFTLSKSSSTKLANSSISIANQVQAIHIGDPVSAQKNQRAVTGALASTMTKIHTGSSSSTNGQLHWSKNSATNSATTPIAGEKSNSSPSPNGGVKTSISKESFQISSPSDLGMEGNLAEMQSLIESID
ncbi:Molybdenum cofactor sulfurase [Orchesella cincta]|uniref:Molybdenum cofactor sulfurase n=1 Tax=Orchesella cincta TaxID=48709 RepID=A0A1D2MNN1_ORCCI|nr:Molybdenum cofactor sulfurase [Orchesella cincta]